MQCCGQNRSTRFCPDCGKPIAVEPLVELLWYCQTQKKKIDRIIDRIIDRQTAPDYVAKCEKQSYKWGSYIEALRNVIEGNTEKQLLPNWRTVLSVRARKALMRCGALDLSTASMLTAEQIASQKNAGVATLEEIRSVLAKYGLHLANEAT